MSPEQEFSNGMDLTNTEFRDSYGNGITYHKSINHSVDIRPESRFVAFEFIYTVLGEKNPRADVRRKSFSSRSVKKLIRTTEIMLGRHDIPFRSACTKLRLSSDAPVSRMLQSIAAELFSNGCNWGRVTSLFSLCRKLVLECKDLGYNDVIHEIARCLADILTGQLSDWISANGGWVSVIMLLYKFLTLHF